MNKKAVLYSLDEKLTALQIKKLDKIEIDENQKKKLISYCDKHNINSFVWEEIFLKKTQNMPYILYYIWNYKLIETKKIIWIVWPREITDFIKKYLDKLFSEIKKFDNIAIVSWLADGTDTYAHKLAIKYNIPTIAVLGFWIAKWLNGTTRHLLKEITNNGWLVISEFKLKQPWTTRTFPKRNRIIAWISDIVFSPQAKEDSGTLITLEDAIKINVPVYSCFSIVDDDFGKWTNKLINKWLINWIFDFDYFVENIKKDFSLKSKNFDKIPDIQWLNNIELKIIENIKKWNNTIEKISINSWLSINEILNSISLLEIKGILQNVWDHIIFKS